MLINEPSALFLVPFGKQLAANAWEIITNLKLLFFPIVALIIREAFDARAQGADEGSAAVLAYKKFERGFIAWFVCVVLFLIPASGKEEYVYKQYSCNAIPSMAIGATNVAELMPRAGSEVNGQLLGQDRSSIMTGLINDMSITTSSVLTGMIPCESNSTWPDVQGVLKDMGGGAVLQNASREFVNQCYAVAVSRINDARERDNYLYEPTDGSMVTDHFIYNSNEMMSAYQGRIYKDGTTLPVIKFNPGRHWLRESADMSGPWGRKQLVAKNCHEAAEQMGAELWKQVDDRYATVAEERQDAGRVTTSADDVRNGTYQFFSSNHDISRAQYDSQMEQFMLFSAYEEGTGQKYEQTNSTVNATAEIMEQQRKLAGANKTDPTLLDYVMTPFMGMQTIKDMTASNAAVYMLPILVSCMQALLLAIIPVAIVLSGCSLESAVKLHITYFGILMVPYFMNIGIYIGSMLGSYIGFWDRMDIDGPIDLNQSLSVDSVSAMFVYVGPIVWMAVVQGIGGMAGVAVGGAVGESRKSGEEQGRSVTGTLSNLHNSIPRGYRDLSNAFSPKEDPMGAMGARMDLQEGKTDMLAAGMNRRASETGEDIANLAGAISSNQQAVRQIKEDVESEVWSEMDNLWQEIEKLKKR
ncbi:hypothetical protein F7U66_01800 [Vibrio parahaemolyticus]|nr:hypothetical protein [Vibrio parahaemolyticus]